ncbi:MAG: CvpA family protein [Lachnospiraceae bacterium]|nr:CvpA family protein [Lachnospiraceae bacterium]
MNAVCIVIGLVFLINVILGWARGFFRVLISVAAAIAGILLGLYFAPYISSYLKENTDTDDKLAVYIEQKLEFSDKTEDKSKGVQVEIIEELPLPDVMKANILNNNNTETYDVLKATGVYDYISKSVAVVILNGAVFLVLALMCIVVFKFMSLLIKGITSIPIIKSIDRIGGGVLGGLHGILMIWVFFLTLSITSTFSVSQIIIKQACESDILKLLYENNILLDIVGDLTKVIF